MSNSDIRRLGAPSGDGSRDWVGLLKWGVSQINLDAFMAGTLCAMGATFAVLSASIDVFVSFAVMAGFLALPSLGRDLLASGGRIARPLGRAALALFFLGVLFGVMAVSERLYLINGSSYPNWLATELSGSWNTVQNQDVVRKSCHGRGGVEVLNKADGRAVLRCGFSWAPGNTFVANASVEGRP